MAGRRRSTRPACRCSRWRWRPRPSAPGPRPSGGCRLPISPCTWCCPRSTGGSSPASPPSRSPATRDAALQFARREPPAAAGRIDAIADRVAAWARLAACPAAARRPALVLSTYPGKPWQMAHAVGLDALASAEAMLRDLAAAGYAVGRRAAARRGARRHSSWPLASYRAALARTAREVARRPRRSLGRARGRSRLPRRRVPFRRGSRRGAALVALQPERGHAGGAAEEYHDLRRVPRHGYVAFYLWLRDAGRRAGPCRRPRHAGMAARQGGGALRRLLARGADRRPAGDLSLHRQRPGRGGAGQAADRRGDARPRAAAAAAERHAANGWCGSRRCSTSSPTPTASIRGGATGCRPTSAPRRRASGSRRISALTPGLRPAEAITRIDRFVCDVKESQFGDGLHVWGRGVPASRVERSAGTLLGGRRDRGAGAGDARRCGRGTRRDALRPKREGCGERHHWRPDPRPTGRGRRSRLRPRPKRRTR